MDLLHRQETYRSNKLDFQRSSQTRLTTGQMISAVLRIADVNSHLITNPLF
jgi:hypothetical protein